MTGTACLVWLRRDLRVDDHRGFAHAIGRHQRIHCAFVFDETILGPLRSRGLLRDRRVQFICDSLKQLDALLGQMGGGVIILRGDPLERIPELARQLKVDEVIAHEDYEPSAIERDRHVSLALTRDGSALTLLKDQVIFAKSELMTGQGRFYSVFTPYKRSWLSHLTPDHIKAHDTALLKDRLAKVPQELQTPQPSPEALGFESVDNEAVGFSAGVEGASALLAEFLPRIDEYEHQRNFPAVPGCSRLSVHLRFGTVSVRALVRAAQAHHADRLDSGAATWLSELIWRDFYAQILFHRPDVVSQPFRNEYQGIRWASGETARADFQAWCEGRTGYPLIDAAMAQINRTGYMHNRLRMVTASFLVKDLGIDWRWGERYFADQLIDYDLASNNGGWQWAASTGCDAQPFFRIFNPITQSEKFDPEGAFIRSYVPALAKVPARWIHAPWRAAGKAQLPDYPLPIVDHDLARAQTLARFNQVRQPGA